MPVKRILSRFCVAAAVSVLALTGCVTAPSAVLQVNAQAGMQEAFSPRSGGDYGWLNRVTWGATTSAVERNVGTSYEAWLSQQLHPGTARLPAVVNAQIAAMTISQRPMAQIAQDMEQRRKDADATVGDDGKKAAQQAWQQEMNRLSKESATRHVLRNLYSSNQVQEQMTWFWMNHFNVHQYKSNIRAMIGDYEEAAVRQHSLGRFRDLLGAVVYHPVMLRYLDNEQNAAGRINENFARELMELHTLGVNGGYSQRDVQELARVLTGTGVNLNPAPANVKRELQGFYVRRGLFEFNPARHDFGDKQFLGQPIKAHGIGEIDEALDRLVRQPETALFISRKLAQYWLADEPPAALIDRMGETFRRSDGDIAQVLHTLLISPEFTQGSPHKFKDPMRYVISSVRLAYDDKPILNTNPILNWLNRMGEPLYGKQTPDGYPMNEAAWASPGQMATRFEVAKAIGSGNAGLFRSEGPEPKELAAFPQLSNALYFQAISKTLSLATKKALDQATSPQEWNIFLLSSPEMMTR